MHTVAPSPKIVLASQAKQQLIKTELQRQAKNNQCSWQNKLVGLYSFFAANGRQEVGFNQHVPKLPSDDRPRPKLPQDRLVVC